MRNGLLIFILTIMTSGGFAAPRCGEIFSISTAFIEARDLVILETLPRGHFKASLNGETVFVKKARGAQSSETQWLTYLNQLGLGVRFYGETRLDPARPDQVYLVMAEAPGINTQIPMLAPESFILTRKMIAEIRRQAEVLSQQGVIPVDLQFQISLDGTSIKIIDPELFRRASSPAEAHQQTQALLNGLFMPWQIEGKIQ